MPSKFKVASTHGEHTINATDLRTKKYISTLMFPDWKSSYPLVHCLPSSLKYNPRNRMSWRQVSEVCVWGLSVRHFCLTGIHISFFHGKLFFIILEWEKNVVSNNHRSKHLSERSCDIHKQHLVFLGLGYSPTICQITYNQ